MAHLPGCRCPGPRSGPGCAPDLIEVSRNTCSCPDTGDLLRASINGEDVEHRCGVHRPHYEAPADDDNPVTVSLNDDKALTAIILGALRGTATGGN